MKIGWAEHKRTKVLMATLETVAAETYRARRHGFDANTTVLNIGLFFLIAERDLQGVKRDALTHPDPWRRGLAARVMLLTIHELDLDKVAGSKLRQALDAAKAPQSLRDEVTQAMRTIRKAQLGAQRQFAHLRNSTIAHRDPNALRQYEDIVAIDTLVVTKIAADFYAGTHLFMAVMPRLLLHLATWPSMIAQLTADREGGGSAAGE